MHAVTLIRLRRRRVWGRAECWSQRALPFFLVDGRYFAGRSLARAL